jgi:hypothetical protein
MGWPDKLRPPFQLTRIPEMDRGEAIWPRRGKPAGKKDFE